MEKSRKERYDQSPEQIKYNHNKVSLKRNYIKTLI